MREPRGADRLVLGIETSGTLTGAALARPGRLLGEMAIDLQASRQELLMEMIRSLLANHGLELQDLSRIGVSLGPGSFTGLRVGLAAARALAVGTGLPLVAVPTHQSMAYPYRDIGLPILVLTGMRRGQICAELGRWERDRWMELFPAASLPADTLWERIGSSIPPSPGVGSGPKPLPQGPLIFLGEAVESGLNASPELKAMGQMLLDPVSSCRRPGPVALLAARDEAEEVTGDDLDRLSPDYLRAVDARKPVNRG